MTSSSMRFSAGAPVAWMMNTSPPRMFSLIRTDTSPSSKRSTSASPSGVLSFSQMALASGRLAFPLKMRHGSKSRSPEAMLRPRMRRGGHPPGHRDPDQASRPSSGWLGREDSNLQYRDPKSRALPLGHAPKTFSPLASPEAPARLARPKPFHRSPRRRHRLGSHAQSHFTARLAGGTGSARTPKAISPLASPEAPARLARPKPFHRSPRRRHRLGSHAQSHFTARLSGGTGSAPTPKTTSPLAPPPAPARLAPPNPCPPPPPRTPRVTVRAPTPLTPTLAT